MKIAVVGLAYVGLPRLLQFTCSDTHVLGLDIDKAKVKSFLAGRSYVKHIESSAMADTVKTGRISASTDFSRVKEVVAGLQDKSRFSRIIVKVESIWPPGFSLGFK